MCFPHGSQEPIIEKQDGKTNGFKNDTNIELSELRKAMQNMKKQFHKESFCKNKAIIELKSTDQIKTQ